jgi:ABC-2 type transport system ATP-binding protein
VIRVRDLVKHFASTAAVRGVSFTLQPGEITGYLGPNGAGKSTTVKMIVGLLRPTSGQIEVCGRDVVAEPVEVKRRIGYVPETAALYATLTPHEHLSLVAELYELDRALARQRISQMLEAFQIADRADQQITALSKGQRQKVLLISALLHEPLNGLDVHAVLALRKIVQHLAQQGRTILFCSHMLDVVERLCSRVIVIDRGQVVADDTTANLLSRAGTLESVFQGLTRRDGEDERIGELLEALGRPVRSET